MSTRETVVWRKGTLCAKCEGRSHARESVDDITNLHKAKAHLKGAVAMLRVYKNVKDKKEAERTRAYDKAEQAERKPSKEGGTAPGPARTLAAAVLPALFLSVNK